MTERKGRTRRNVQGFNVSVWTLNGQPLPERVDREVEKAVQKIVNESEIRLLMSIHRG
jgi:hypothetical protein